MIQTQKRRSSICQELRNFPLGCKFRVFGRCWSQRPFKSEKEKVLEKEFVELNRVMIGAGAEKERNLPNAQLSEINVLSYVTITYGNHLVS